MTRFWMMGGAILSISVAAMVWSREPVRSSENLLGKAQSEFAMKARDALAQRYMAQASTAPATAGTPATGTQMASLPNELPLSKPAATAVPSPESAKAEARIGPLSSAAPQRTAARTLTQEELKSLRARSPELAAAIARYM